MNSVIYSLKYDSDKDEQQSVFAEPWEACIFAIEVKLSENSLFKWPEWSDALTKEIKMEKEKELPEFNKTYYQFWLSALETILLDKNMLNKTDLKSRMEQWRSTHLSTPHGNPVKLVKYK